MLLADRRVTFLHLLLAAMQALWIAPFLALAWTATLSPWEAFVIALAGLLGWMLALELLSRWAEPPLYDTLAVGLLAAVSLVLVRLVLYGGGWPWDLSWIGRSVIETINWTRGLPPAMVIVAVNIFLWHRASTATSRDLHFFGVGLTFRSGLLLLLVGGGLYGGYRGTAPLGLLWLYLALGLTAVAVSRVAEKAEDAQSVGRLLPPQRVAQTLVAVAGAIGLTWLASLIYTRASIISFFRLFEPLWRLVRPLLVAFLVFLMRLLSPVMLWMEGVLRRLVDQFSPELMEVLPSLPGTEEAPNLLERLPDWPLALVRTALIVVGVVLVLAGLVFFLLFYLERVRKPGLIGEAEDEGQDQATFGGGLLGQALDSLRGVAGLVRRFGLGRELLAAISVQNIYANLCRLARQQGKPRLPSQPPDVYLPVLEQVFPGEEERLGRITAAYMRVHYGDHPVRTDELANLREDYRVLRQGV